MIKPSRRGGAVVDLMRSRSFSDYRRTQGSVVRAGHPQWLGHSGRRLSFWGVIWEIMRKMLNRRSLISTFAALLVILPVVIHTAYADGGHQKDRFMSRGRQLLLEGRRAGEGYFSPDGTKMILQAERHPGNPFFQIYILDLISGHIRLISPGVGSTTCSYFRPGTDEVLFASTHLDPQAREKERREYEERPNRTTGHTINEAETCDA